MRLKIINWDKYNPKRSQHSYTWLRLNNTVFTDPEIFDLPHESKLLWIFLLCEASKHNGKQFNFSVNMSAKLMNISDVKVQESLTQLKDLKMIKIDASSLQSTTIHYTYETNETNETRRTNNIAHSRKAASLTVSRLESLYQSYPLKKGKQRGVSKLKSILKTEDDAKEFEQAVKNYRDQIAREQIEPKFIKHFSSFVASWRDYLDKDSGTCDTGGAKTLREILEERGEL